MMKKQFLAGIMSFTLAASMLAGCGKDTEIKESASGRSKEFESVDNSESSLEISSETAAENASIEDNIYESFMNGDVKVKYQNLPSKGGDALSDYLEDGKEYDINEIIKCIENDHNTVDGDHKYCYIDCGEDGIKELLVKLDLGASSSLSFILKEFDGKLKICYSGEAWERSELSISDTGMISSAGSAGATAHGGDFAFVNADGDYKFFYSSMTEGDPYSYYAYNEAGDMVTVKFEGLETEHFMITRYYIEDENGVDHPYYTYDMLDEDYSIITTDECFDESNPYMQRFIEAGIKVYKQNEIDEMLTKKAEEISYPGGYHPYSSDEEDNQYGISLVSMEHKDVSSLCPDDQFESCRDVSLNDITGDITEYVDGIKGTRFDGHLAVFRSKNDSGDIIYSFTVDGKEAGSCIHDAHDFKTIDYIQAKDIDGDGVAEILIVTYTYSSEPIIAVDFSALKYCQNENAADGSSYGIYTCYHLNNDFSWGNAYFYIEHDEALTSGNVVYVSLEDSGLRVVVDKGEKVNGAYEFDTYDVVMKLG